MPPHISWAQVWATLRPQLQKLGRQPWVWVSGVGLAALLGAELWLQVHTPAVPTPALPGQTPAVPDLFGDVSLAISVTVKLALVIALIYGCLFLLRKWQGGWLAPRQKHITLLETTRLSPRQALHLVRVDNRLLLIGATDQALALLSEVDPLPSFEAAALPSSEAAALPSPEAAALPTTQAAAFAATLDQALAEPQPAGLAAAPESSRL